MDTSAHHRDRSRKLDIALNIGTAASGTAYAFLEPVKIPWIRFATK